MANSNHTDVHVCMEEPNGIVLLVLAPLVLPLHSVLIKVHTKEYQFTLPRHKILLCLSLSDAIQIFTLFIIGLVNEIVTLTPGSTGCMVYRAFAKFICCSMLVVSSLSITAMTLERYIACIHSFRLHQMFTESRVRYGSILVWMLGVLFGSLAALTTHIDDAVTIPNRSVFQYVYLLFVIPQSVFIIITQVRLFLFCRKKIKQVIPAGAFGAELELANYRKKHFKVAFMAGIVALAFLLCMIPMATIFLYELLTGEYVSASLRSACFGLSMCNSLADPFIYGFGIADIRRVIFREVKKLKQLLIEVLLDNLW